MDTIVLKVDSFLDVAAARDHTTYEQQSEATGISVGALHRLRNGGPAHPTAIARICQTYGVNFDDVFEFGSITPTRSKTTARSIKAAAA